MVTKRTRGDLIFDCFNYLLLTALTLITLYPFVHVVAGSISGPGTLIGHKGALLWPKGTPTLKAFALVFRNPNIITGYKNTLIVLLVATTLNIVMTSLGAYVLSRPQFAIRKVMMFLIVFTMYFSGGMIPRYLFLKNYLGMGDHLGSLIIPGAISAYNLIIMRTAFASVPASLEESARIDGANDFTILFRIILPLSMATVAVMILFYGVGHWNAWFDAMIFLRTREKYPLQLILREILVNNSTESMTMGAAADDVEQLSDNLKYATIVVATLPILCVYPLIQKHFVKGVMIGAVKG
ncbi:MAG: carbohydrate ABC transporter permease [Eubacteriales bacterium]|nr:carbohydrate ABC transporter permease [Eubacteriales bacterium]